MDDLRVATVATVATGALAGTRGHSRPPTAPTRVLIAVQTTEPARSVARGESKEAPPQELRDLAAELRIAFRATHPGADDPLLRRFFTVEVLDAEEARRVVARLLASPAIAAAYVKPPDEMP